MCFYNDDHDWVARVYEEEFRTAEKPTHCDECGADIPAGAKYHSIFMQEYEECRDCFGGYCQCPGGNCCACPSPNFGESSTYGRCLECNKFLQAVQFAEEDAGCKDNETRPPLDRMLECIREAGAREAKRYYQKAREAYPELVASGYLPKLWRRMFGE